MTSPLALHCENLGKVYRVGFWKRKVDALRRLNLEVQPGEIFGFIGPNGAGKTSTIKILAGLHRATTGEAKVFGLPAGSTAANALIGFLPERPYFYAHLTSRELLRFYGNLFDLRGSMLEKRIDELLDRVQLRDVEDVQLKAYSKGMLQRAGLAQALINRPKLILLDEPMSGLDPMGRMLVREIILEQKAQGATLFFSSHILADVEQICDRVALMVGGDLKAEGPIEELLSANVEVVECVVSNCETLPEGATVIGQDGRQLRLRLSAQDVDSFVADLLAKGGQLHEVVPKRQTLEALLVEQLGIQSQATPSQQEGTP
ncbi:MAG: ABC transporter ATP-binding protein [Myxococcota bacterium]|nr:ABC transporter ATP-binding protein [Myxococcota bacterium]